ncbi:MAG: DUF4394 domain-containing protein [Chloroflexota bacterium]|nr:DUF4394 domain-containing protein [Chloroflexota bacterium]
MFRMKWIVVLALLLAVTGSAVAQSSGTAYAVTDDGRLIAFSTSAPGTLTLDVPITGLADGETLVGIDIRPADGSLFALSSSSRVYQINTGSGAASARGSAFSPALSGSSFGFDFNPTVDRIRTTSDARQTLRLNPNNGAVAATDGTLGYNSVDVNSAATPVIVASAYTNNFSGAGSTLLFNIDSALDILVTQNPPNSGTLNTIGAIGVDANANTSLDIMSDRVGSDAAFASIGSTFYSVNLANGAFTAIGSIGASVRAIAVTNSVRTQVGIPSCADFNGSTSAVVRAGLPDGRQANVFCRVLAENGALSPQAGAQIGVAQVIQRGVIQAVDVFSPYQTQSFGTGAVVCLLGTGSFVFLDATQTPRLPTDLGTFDSGDGYTCANVINAGTAVLVRN